MTACQKALVSQPKEITEVLREVIAEAEKDIREGKTQ
jgi:hypothetical protein